MFEIGSSLREARLRQGVDLVEAEQATKIRAKYLRALEDERFELLPAQTYVKGFLRSYADYLGLDGQLYVDEYNSRYVSGDDETPLRPRRTQRTPAERRLEASVVLFALAGIAAAAALVVIAWKFGGGAEETRAPALRPAGATAASPARPGRAAPRGEEWIALEVLATRGSSSLAVYRHGRRGDRLLFNGTLERGNRQRFTGPRLWLNVSNPENLTFRLNKKRAILRGAGARPTRVIVTRQGLARAGS